MKKPSPAKKNKIKYMPFIKVNAIQFSSGGNTLWVHSDQGTVLRIKCTGHIRVNEECENIVCHADMIVQGDIDLCIKPDQVFDTINP